MRLKQVPIRYVAAVALALAFGPATASMAAADSPLASTAAAPRIPARNAATRSPSLAAVDANARAEGNRRTAAVALGTALFGRIWPVQILKVRVDGIGANEVAGLALSGVKFHGRVNARDFAREVTDLVRLSFAAVPISEVDVWATTPLNVAKGTIVAGDNAQPTARVVFGATVPRSQATDFPGRLAAGSGIYWNPSWKNSLERIAADGARHAGRAAAAKTTRQGANRRLGVAKRARVLMASEIVRRSTASRPAVDTEPRSGELFV